jgi:hypothetical protein
LRHRIASFLDSLSEEEHKNQHRRMSKDYEREPYSPECVEWVFSEVRIAPVLFGRASYVHFGAE